MLLTIDWNSALIVTFIGFLLVFAVLCLLVFLIQIFGTLMTRKIIIRRVKKPVDSEIVATSTDNDQHSDYDEVILTADESAAIAMALHLYYADVHDEESHVMTIKTVERRYSPWSSKIHGLNNLIR